MAGALGDVVWALGGDVRAGVFALMASNGACGMHGDAFGCCRAFLGGGGGGLALGPPRLVDCFGRRVLRRMVAAFSTFSSICVVVLVCHVLMVCFWVTLVSELESSSQSLVSAMMDSLSLLIVCFFICIEIVLRQYVAKVSNGWMMGNSLAEQFWQGGAWKQLSSGKE